MSNSKIIKDEKNNMLVRLLSHRILFALHLFLYLAVMGLLILVWALTSGFGFFWPYFAMFGWGYAIGFHAITYLMYNDKIEYLTRIRHRATFVVLFIYHAWFYISVNTFLILTNLLLTPRIIYFIWPLLFWGIAFGFHAFGFFMWETTFDREMTKLKEKYREYEVKKLKMMATSKISNFWLMIIHISYFIIVTMWLYISNFLGFFTLNLANSLEGTLMWGTFLGVHILGYLIFYFIETIKSVIKGLIINILLYSASNAWMLYAYFKNPSAMFWPKYPLILWGIAIAIHVYISINWDLIKEDAIKIILTQFGDSLDIYDKESKAFRLSFWKWTFITHIAVWVAGIVLIGIDMAIVRVPIGLLIHPAMGWLIAVFFHGAIFMIYQKNITGFWRPTALIHLAVFISTSAYLIVLNVLTSPFPWSAIAIVGWGIGLGLHLIIAYFRKK